MNDIAIIEENLNTLAPRFEDVLAASGVPVQRLIRSVMIAIDRNDQLANPAKCNRQSLLMATMTAAVLGLEMDGATGQCFPIPFAGKAQCVIGYKGFNTMAGRSAFTINGDVIRQDDEFLFDAGAGTVSHRFGLGDRGRVVGAWAKADSNRQPSIGPVVMGLAELRQVMAKSPGSKKSDSPWNDPNIGFPAMCAKTPKRRLARAMPMNLMLLGSAVDEAYEERGLHSYLTPDQQVIIGNQRMPAAALPPVQAEQQPIDPDVPAYEVELADGSRREFDTLAQWEAFMKRGLDAVKDRDRLESFIKRNNPILGRLREGSKPEAEAVTAILSDYNDRVRAFEQAAIRKGE